MALIKEVKGLKPQYDASCYLSDNATLVGNVTLGRECSVWFNAVIRGDVSPVKIGNGVNVQDGACIHVSRDAPTLIEDGVSIGHNATVHGCVLHAGALVGMGAVVMDHAEIGSGAIVAAGAVVLQGTKVGDGEIWAGVPAKNVGLAKPGMAEDYAKRYVGYISWYKDKA
ncbi:MAG: gamma carbonic anhydrase family protein [Bacteroidales bacterium]|nr:gamma carbonic anhydrase family protein [Bacteroidales bacterium]